MYEFAIVFVLVLVFFLVIKPNCAKTRNPYTPPKFSVGLAVFFSVLITALIAVPSCMFIPHFKKSCAKIFTTAKKTSKKEDTPASEEKPEISTTEEGFRLKPFSV
jgi:uncharacterized oligopeptide transporter (OPT) family protein